MTDTNPEYVEAEQEIKEDFLRPGHEVDPDVHHSAVGEKLHVPDDVADDLEPPPEELLDD